MPVIVAHHRQDNCHVTPPGNVDDLLSGLKNAKGLNMLWFEGGVDSGPSCDAGGHHGLGGIERQVVHDIAEAIKKSFAAGR